MKIRSITCFTDIENFLDKDSPHQWARISEVSRTTFEEGGYDVQTLRLATPPFPMWRKKITEQSFKAFARELEGQAGLRGFNYVSLGPALPSDPESYPMIPACLEKTENTFFSGVMATREGGVSLSAVRECAKIIHQLAKIEPNGFSNLYFTALGNVQPGAPFFPAAYTTAGENGFGLALEAADLAVSAFGEAKSLHEARQRLTDAVEFHSARLVQLAEKISEKFQIPFMGLDFTLAPFVVQESSLGEAIERLGVSAVGLHGSLAAAAFITDILDSAKYPRIGFNGLMLPVLEDYQLAARAAEGILTVKDLLLYSCVCGTGLDTIPLPGDVSEEALAAVLLDLAVLSLRLNKPLTARLMPIPGKKAGEMTNFDFPFFRNTRVMGLDSRPLTGLFARDETLRINSRGSY